MSSLFQCMVCAVLSEMGNDPTPIQRGPRKKFKKILSSRRIRNINSYSIINLLFMCYLFINLLFDWLNSTTSICKDSTSTVQGNKRKGSNQCQKRKLENKTLKLISYKD